MKHVLFALSMVLAVAARAQVRPAPSPTGSAPRPEAVRAQDLRLELGLRSEAIKEAGILRLCVAKDGQCIENLTLGFTVRVYDAQGAEIWNSIWTGRSLDLQFKKPLPNAHRVVVTAVNAQVVNKLSGNPISTGKPLKLEFVVE